MKITVVFKKTNETVEYSNALGYDTHGAITIDNAIEPVFQIILEDGIATFPKKDWDVYVLQKLL